MRPTSYQSEDLDRLLRKHKIATLDDLKAVLGTDVDSTVFRKLNELAYRTRIRPDSRGNKNGVTSG